MEDAVEILHSVSTAVAEEVSSTWYCFQCVKAKACRCLLDHGFGFFFSVQSSIQNHYQFIHHSPDISLSNIHSQHSMNPPFHMNDTYINDHNITFTHPLTAMNDTYVFQIKQ